TMAQPEIRRTQRRLPHWTLEGSTYFVTFRLARGELSSAERRLVLDHVVRGNGPYYTLLGAVIMTDHVHLLLKPNSRIELTRVMRGVKGVSARLINEQRGTKGTIWQDESWDRMIRDEAEPLGFADYLVTNPVKAGLCREPQEYEWLFIDKEIY